MITISPWQWPQLLYRRKNDYKNYREKETKSEALDKVCRGLRAFQSRQQPTACNCVPSVLHTDLTFISQSCSNHNLSQEKCWIRFTERKFNFSYLYLSIHICQEHCFYKKCEVCPSDGDFLKVNKVILVPALSCLFAICCYEKKEVANG